MNVVLPIHVRVIPQSDVSIHRAALDVVLVLKVILLPIKDGAACVLFSKLFTADTNIFWNWPVQPEASAVRLRATFVQTVCRKNMF